MSWRQIVNTVLACSVITCIPIGVLADEPCPGNRLANAAFEEGSRGTAGMGTRPSSVVANAWNPWSIWGYSPYSSEAEFDIEDITRLGRYSTYRVHTGHYSQKFSTVYGVHTAGMYQRVPVPKGSTVTFSISVQIYTGEESSISGEELVSDLNHPGNYRVYVGIDPYGEEPPGFGAPPSERTVWSEPVIDHDTRRFNEQGQPYDAWSQIKVTAEAKADFVTVFTKGQPEFPVRNNVSYWDDACLTFIPPKPVPTATPKFTRTLQPTHTRTHTPTAPATPRPSETPLPVATTLPTETMTPAQTLTSVPTETPMPTATTLPSRIPTQTKVPASAAGDRGSDNPFLLLIFAAVWLSAAGYLGWSLWQRRRASFG